MCILHFQFKIIFAVEASVEALLHLSSTERIEPDSTTNTTEDDSNSDSVIASEKKFIDENAIPDNEDHKNTFDSKITTLECNNMVQEITNAISENKIMVLEKKVSESLNQIQNNNLYSNITSLPTTSSFTRHYKTPQRRKPSPQELAVEYLKNLVLKGTKLLVIMRGLPGSGKSSLARLILKSCYPNKNFNLSLLSTDDYFLKGKNTYVYDVTKLQYAHAWNQSRAAVALQQGLNPVVIDNTNLEYWEMQPYILLGKNMGYTIEILEPFTSWAFKVNELAKRNTHGVPKEKIKSMLTRYDKSMLTLNKKISSNPNAFLIPEEINTSEVITKSELKSCQNFNLGSHEETFFGDSGGDTQNTKNRFENTYEESKDNDLGIEAKSFNSFSDSSNLNVLNEPDDEENSNSDVWKSNEETLRSWDLTSVADVTVFYPVNLKKDNFAFTDPHDFLIANYEMNTDLKILYSNGNFQPARINDVFDRKPLSKLSLEKGTMTEDKISDDNINKEADLNKLYDLFPYLQKDVVNDVFEKCSCDIDWTADILLDSNQEIGKISQNQSFTSESSSNDFLSCETSRSENFNTNEATVQSSDDNEMEFNDLSNNLKPEGDIVNLNKQQAQDEQFTFVQTPNFFECNTIFQDFEDDNSKNFDDEVEDLPGTSQSPEVSVESEGEFFELNLGSNLIEQLESKFGDETFKYPKGFLPVVQIPVDLGRQLYAFYLESVYQQLDVQNQILNSVVKEDEEFAKKLQAIEFDQAKLINNTECPNLKIIMEEEAKMGNFAKQEKLKKNNEENLALILTKVKLFENFPNIEKKVVAEVLNEQDNHYEKAVEVLSTMKPMVRDSLVDTESWEDLSVDVVIIKICVFFYVKSIKVFCEHKNVTDLLLKILKVKISGAAKYLS